ncbi:hypothetical protein KAM385_41790 [Aeromonas hydrophila]|nr:hypothetical protein KAM385_41790 [Aeromonas hydrophila]
MALMQVAHGGHECDCEPFTAPLADLFTQSGGIVNDQHQQFTFEKIKERRAVWARMGKKGVATGSIIDRSPWDESSRDGLLSQHQRAKRGRRPPLSSRYRIS